MIQGLRAECRHGRTTHPPTRELACTHALTQPARTHQVAREIEAQSTSDPETGKALVRELLGDDTEDCACTDLEITLRCVSACVRVACEAARVCTCPEPRAHIDRDLHNTTRRPFTDACMDACTDV